MAEITHRLLRTHPRERCCFKRRAEVDRQRAVGACVAQLRLLHRLDPRGIDALGHHLLARVLDQRLVGRFHRRRRLGAERHLDLLLAQRPHVGEAHAVGREHSRVRVDEHPGHRQRIGDQAGVLPGGPAEAAQRIGGDVMAALHRDVLDRIGHVADRDLHEAFGNLLDRAVVGDLRLQRVQRRELSLAAQRRVKLHLDAPVQGAAIRRGVAGQWARRAAAMAMGATKV